MGDYLYRNHVAQRTNLCVPKDDLPIPFEFFIDVQRETKSVQRQVQTLIKRKDAYNMQVLQDWKTFRRSRLTFLSDPSTKTDQDESPHVLSDSTLCVGVTNSDPPNNWATKLDEVRNEHGFVEKSIWQPDKCDSCGTYYQVLLPFQIKKHVQDHLKGLTPEAFENGIIFISFFNDNDGTEKSSTEICLHNAKEVAAFAATVKPGHWCFLGRASEMTWWNGNPNLLRGKLEKVTTSKVHTRMRRFSSIPCWQATYCVFRIEIAGRMISENWVPYTEKFGRRWRSTSVPST